MELDTFRNDYIVLFYPTTNSSAVALKQIGFNRFLFSCRVHYDAVTMKSQHAVDVWVYQWNWTKVKVMV